MVAAQESREQRTRMRRVQRLPMIPVVLLCAVSLAATSCQGPAGTGTPSSAATAGPAATVPALPLQPVRVERAFPGLSFQRLTDMAQPPGGLYIFAAEQSGRLWAFEDDPQASSATLVLDISSQVLQAHNEEGLLGLAFDPLYGSNGYLYLYYSAAGPRRNVLARFTLSGDGSPIINPASQLVLLEIGKPFGNHNGGQLAFGPDGYLYIGVGDGGGSGDPYGNSQNRGTLLGKLLRIDVRGATQGHPYLVPPDNPFVGVPGAREEVWAYGLRNPWRFAFDAATGLLWLADVGQNAWEEVDIITKGGNYGWKVMEGNHCYSPRQGCQTGGLEPPVAEYSHAEGCSVTGGYVYRGERLPSLYGAYVYADYCSGAVWGLRYRDGRVAEHLLLATADLGVTSFAQDARGELYLLSQDQGVYRLAP
ncbi:MAG: PQQ-dependent sugar dehydrogenase [Chloroflexi bacterium]|nr:PQQ-dependent sugar dehydrogenase [Chloroflexota bacterium]